MDKQKNLNCPKCGAEITFVAVEGMTFESCENCHGFFLNSEEFITNKKILDSAQNAPPREDAQDLNKMKINCPSCNLAMNKVQPQHKPHLLLDICPSCSGIWFDQGEYTKFRGKLTNSLFKPKNFKVKFSCAKCKVKAESKTSREIPQCPQCGKLMASNAVGLDSELDYNVSVLTLIIIAFALGGLFLFTNHFLTTPQAILITALAGAVDLIALSFFTWRKINDDFFPGPFIFPYR